MNQSNDIAKKCLVESQMSITVASDAIAVIKKGGMGKEYKVVIIPDFDNADRAPADLRYDVRDGENKQINTYPLTEDLAQMLLKLVDGSIVDLIKEIDIATPKEVTESPKECFVVEVMTGCTCCRDENFFEGPFMTIEDARKKAEYHKTNRTLRSQYAESGHQTIMKIDCELVGHWLILDDYYAVRYFDEDGEPRGYTERLDKFTCYGTVVK